MTSHDDVFRHEPLPDPDTHFRLLRITRGGFNESVVCKTSDWPIEDAPEYVALSYVWGDPSEVSTITINSRPATVRANCEYVLQQQAAASESLKFYYWIDAICIDQHNTAEKTHQVAQMGRIYSMAKRVHACTGPHANHSHAIFTDTDPAGRLFSRIARIHDARINWTLKFVLQTICFLAAGRETRKTLLDAYEAFLKRSYFSRVWVLQEIFLGKKVWFYCGDGNVPATHFQALRKLTAFWGYSPSQSTFLGRSVENVVRAGLQYALHYYQIAYRPDAGKLGQDDALHWRRSLCLVWAVQDEGSLSLTNVLQHVRYFDCTDPRDRVYGILSMVDWKQADAILPDYAKDCFEVATEVLGRMLPSGARFVEASDRGPVRFTQIGLAARIRDLFPITMADTSMTAALMKRGQPSPTVHKRGEHFDLAHRARYIPVIPKLRPASKRWIASAFVPPSYMVHEDWEGVMLGSKADDGTCTLKVVSVGDRAELFCDGSLIGYAHPDTKPGDWIIWFTTDSHKTLDLAITAGRLANGNYGLKGYVYMLPDWSRDWSRDDDPTPMKVLGPILKNFAISWHAEDLLIFEWHISHRPSACGVEAGMTEWLQMRICNEEGSSVAAGQNEIREREEGKL